MIKLDQTTYLNCLVLKLVIIYTTKLGCVIQSAQQYEILMFNDKNNSWIFPNLDCTSNDM